MMGNKFAFTGPKVHHFNKNIMKNSIESENNSVILSPLKNFKNENQSKSSFKKYLVDYANISTVHGLRHLVAPARHIFEKLLMTIIILGSLVILFILSLDFWDRYQNNPTVIVLDHEYRSFNITKPAIILCPVNRIDENKFSTIFKKYGINDTENTRKFFQFIAHATYNDFTEVPEFTDVKSNLWMFILHDLHHDVILKTNQEQNWIITERGVCLSVNNYASPYSDIDHWRNNSWTVIIPTEVDSYQYATREMRESIKIIGHRMHYAVIYPGDILATETKFYVMEEVLSLNTLILETTEISTSEQVKSLSLTQRKCKLFEEGGLTMWPIYTRAMCANECRYKQIYEICECHPHFARPMPGIPVCDTTQLRCIGKNLDRIILTNEETEKMCNCYSDCEMAKYEEEFANEDPLKPGSPPEAVLNVKILFPSDKYKRELLFGFNDFLASVGGGAGLLLGASVLSFVEIFYFGTLRLIWRQIKLV